ncbi:MULTISPECIES: LapA family protein [Polaromonas]|uniref:Lipopolysaccharide assembly LapA domain-containing protein n=1 Tax=Polaromonas aquatica TaxID=332657 RepID=A0ABW1TR66_9BURK
MKYLMWLLKAAIFFTLFAFALNNQQAVAVYFFFGTLWKAPLVLVVLAAFACGLALGVLVMMPRWWKKRRATHLHSVPHPDLPVVSGGPAAPANNTSIPRHGL